MIKKLPIQQGTILIEDEDILNLKQLLGSSRDYREDGSDELGSAPSSPEREQRLMKILPSTGVNLKSSLPVIIENDYQLENDLNELSSFTTECQDEVARILDFDHEISNFEKKR